MRSIMMVTYNRLELTKQTVKNIFDTVSGDFNFIIVDNGSKDGTVEYLNELSNKHNNIYIHLFSENKGIGKGRNKALKIAVDLGTEWFVTLDNDVLLPNGWLDECIHILENVKTYGAIGVNFEGVEYNNVNINGISFQSKPRGNLGTACMVFGKSLQKMLGFFDDYNNLYGEEDADFGHRIRVLGLKLGYINNKGNHIGVGEVDSGEYREFKDNCRKKNLNKFYENCRLYSLKKKPLYIKYTD